MQLDKIILYNFLIEKGMSQSALAKAAGVSQPTVSRALSGIYEKHGGARKRLMDYVSIDRKLCIKMNSRDSRLKVLAAFEQIWDSSDDHAEAIANVIKALGSFKNKKRAKSQ